MISTLFAVYSRNTKTKLPFQLRLRFRSLLWKLIWRNYLVATGWVHSPFLANDRETYTRCVQNALTLHSLEPKPKWLSRYTLSRNRALPLCTDYGVTPHKKHPDIKGKTTSTILELLLLKCVAISKKP